MKGRLNWTQEEDNFIKEIREKIKINSWKKISNQLNKKNTGHSRHAKQCRERYINHLKFKTQGQTSSIWEKFEQRTLFEKYLQIGPKWVQLAIYLPNKSQNNIKNKFYGELRKTLRKMNKLEKQRRIKNQKELKYEALIKIIQLCNPKNETSLNKIGEKIKQFQILRHDLLFHMIRSVDEENEEQFLSLAARIHAFNIQTRFIFRSKKKNKEINKNISGETVFNETKQSVLLKQSGNNGNDFGLVIDLKENKEDDFFESQVVALEAYVGSPVLIDCFDREFESRIQKQGLLADEHECPPQIFF